MSKQISPVLAVVVAITVGGASDAAWAQPLNGRERVVRQVRVPVGDLDLSRPAGADTLLKRVRMAAARACRSPTVSSATVLDAARAERTCREQAVSRAVAQVDNPVVQARYAASNPPRPVKVAEARP